MDFLTKYRRKVALKAFLVAIVPVILTIASWYITLELLNFEPIFIVVISLSVGISASIITSQLFIPTLSDPLEKIQEIVLYAAHTERGGNIPDISKLKVANDLVENLSREIYNLGSSSAVNETNTENQSISSEPARQTVIDSIPLPIFGLDQNQIITFANKATSDFLSKDINEILGKPFYDSFNLSFKYDISFEEWLKESKKNSVTATRIWDRVRHTIESDKWKQFDLVANFSSGSSSGTETTIAIFDRTDKYNTDDYDASIVALAVHELRTPLTIMRGYIEVFQDEIGPTLSPELKDFMHKMQASAEQLTSFVGNILNVAKVEEDQLQLKLRKEDLANILGSAISDLELRAQVHGKHINLKIDENIPEVAADRISIHEVINNLVENAIKYSHNSENIDVKAYVNSEGLPEVSVQDYGIGIPQSVMGELFQKFHRSHKTKAQVGGTGLGLYLCKALIKAHGGNIWVRSKEGEGAIFSFTLLPYDQLSSEQVEGEDGIIRGAHGWIKNHSLYRN